jgi:hypothetical protein
MKDQIDKVYKFKRLRYEDNKIPAGIELNQIYDQVKILDHPYYPSACIK